MYAVNRLKIILAEEIDALNRIMLLDKRKPNGNGTNGNGDETDMEWTRNGHETKRTWSGNGNGKTKRGWKQSENKIRHESEHVTETGTRTNGNGDDAETKKERKRNGNDTKANMKTK